jgi:hypothetical protein
LICFIVEQVDVDDNIGLRGFNDGKSPDDRTVRVSNLERISGYHGFDGRMVLR